MNPEHIELAEKVIEFFKNSDKYSLIPARDLLHILNDRHIAEKVISPLEKDFGLLERSGKHSLRLTKKGWEFTSFANLEQEKKSDVINNDFSNSTIGHVNQTNILKNKNSKIKQTIHSNIKEKKPNAIISFLEKFWWKILIPLTIGIVLILIERGIIHIGI